MGTFLFDEIIFGPVYSRRFGVSLGVNLLPLHSKLCSFNCIYCECGLTCHKPDYKARLLSAAEILNSLELKLKGLQSQGILPDNITFAGNGEPTLHPEFDKIVIGTIELRNSFSPSSLITVLSNGTNLKKNKVADVLKRIDNNVLKLDAGTEETFHLVNRPLKNVTLDQIVESYAKFDGEVIIQTLFIRGEIGKNYIDNTNETEVDLWLNHLARIRPKMVMIYPIARQTPYRTLKRVDNTTLEKIRLQVIAIGLNAEVFT